jgi:hypothetical protein
MKANPKRYAERVCCISNGVAPNEAEIPENAGKYVSIENGPSMPNTANKTAKAHCGKRQRV